MPVKPLWVAPSELLGPTKGLHAVIYWPCDAVKDMSFSPTAKCYGVFAQYRFRVCSGQAPGRNRVPGTGFREPVSEWQVFRLGEPVLGTGSGFRYVPTGFAVPRFRPRRLKEVSKVSVFDQFRGVRLCSRGFDGTVSGNRVPRTRGIKKVPGQGFRQLLCTSKVYSCTFKM